MNTLNQSIAAQGHRPLLPASQEAAAAAPAALHLHLAGRARHAKLVVEVDTEEDARMRQQPPSSSALVGGFLRSFLQKGEASPPAVALAVSVLSAVKLERKQMTQIEKKMQRLTGFQHVKLENTIDATLIAGFVIRYGADDAHVIDLSVKGQLAQIAERLESSDESQAWNLSRVF